MDNIIITFENGEQREYKKGIKLKEIIVKAIIYWKSKLIILMI